VRVKAGEFVERFLAVARGFNSITPQSDHAGKSRALRFFVVNYQDTRDGTVFFHLVLL